MRHVFVETNWVVAYAAPEHLQVPEALSLTQKAAAGELRLYLPSVCLAECQYTIRTRYRPRPPADALRLFLRSALTAIRRRLLRNLSSTNFIQIDRRVSSRFVNSAETEDSY